MKTILEYVDNLSAYNILKTIDSQIVCEKLNCKVLYDVASQLSKLRDDELDKKQTEEEEYIKKYGKSFYSGKAKNGRPYVNAYNRSFRMIFGNEMIRFDKITDSDIVTYEPDDKKHDKIVRDQVKNGYANNTIMVLQDPDTNRYKYFIDYSGYLISLDSINRYNHAGETQLRRYAKSSKDLPTKEKVELCKGLRIYLISFSKDEKQNIRNERNISKTGMIYMDSESLRKYAQENVKRYKEIIAQNKANRLNDDKLLEDVQKIIEKVASLAVECAKDPILNADVAPVVEDLCRWIYDKREYHYSPGRRDGYYSGVNGILPQLPIYTKYLKELKVGNNSPWSDARYSDSSFRAAKKNIEEAVKKCHELLKKINEDV